MNYSQRKAIENEHRLQILSVNPLVTDESGVYILTREELGIKYAYIGQAKHILTRLANHLNGYQHIDLSIKKHKLYSKTNPLGWKIEFILYPEEMLDEKEKFYITEYANRGYQLRNKTLGGQNEGKNGLDNIKPARGYHDGLKQGYENARREVKHLFDLHLDVVKKSDKPNKTQDKALQKFYDFLES